MKIRPQALRTASHSALSSWSLQSFDLPITKGLRERAHEFRELDEPIELRPCSMMWPRCRRSTSLAADTEARLPLTAGAH